ncbi:MAG: D-amino-acid transaminase [Hyphococcus sp.]|nr:MAG: D-amino-acid transaminase [Marinicaulis sp.]
MAQIAYVNGAYVRHCDAAVHIEDRGYQFADGIYEACIMIDGRCWDIDGHLERMKRSLDALEIDMPMGRRALMIAMGELVRRNRLRDAFVYLQVTRGVAPRNHPFPKPWTPPALVMTARRFNLDQSDAQAARGVSVISHPDIRWGRVDIKSVGLLPNVLAKEAAVKEGAYEAWLVRDDKVTEGSSTNAWIVDDQGVLITHPKSHEILGGITRETALVCAQELQIKVHERAFALEEAKNATEAFITSATSFVMPVTKIDTTVLGNGKPGPVALRLREAYKAKAREIAGA